jgi:hypothetical protein
MVLMEQASSGNCLRSGAVLINQLGDTQEKGFDREPYPGLDPGIEAGIFRFQPRLTAAGRTHGRVVCWPTGIYEVGGVSIECTTDLILVPVLFERERVSCLSLGKPRRSRPSLTPSLPPTPTAALPTFLATTTS